MERPGVHRWLAQELRTPNRLVWCSFLPFLPATLGDRQVGIRRFACRSSWRNAGYTHFTLAISSAVCQRTAMAGPATHVVGIGPSPGRVSDSPLRGPTEPSRDLRQWTTPPTGNPIPSVLTNSGSSRQTGNRRCSSWTVGRGLTTNLRRTKASFHQRRINPSGFHRCSSSSPVRFRTHLQLLQSLQLLLLITPCTQHRTRSEKLGVDSRCRAAEWRLGESPSRCRSGTASGRGGSGTASGRGRSGTASGRGRSGTASGRGIEDPRSRPTTVTSWIQPARSYEPTAEDRLRRCVWRVGIEPSWFGVRTSSASREH